MDIPVYSIPSLLDLCVDVLIERLNHRIYASGSDSFQFGSDDGLSLSIPPEVGDTIIKRLNKRNLLSEAWLSLFRPGSLNQLRRLYARRSNITNRSLTYLVNQELQEIDLSENDGITDYALYLLETRSKKSLRHLNLSHCISIRQFRCISGFEALRSLDASYTLIQFNLSDIGKRLHHLKVINLSGISLKDLKGLEVLAATLECLILFDSLAVNFILRSVLKLKNLRKLDISCSPINGFEHMRQYEYVEDELFQGKLYVERNQISTTMY